MNNKKKRNIVFAIEVVILVTLSIVIGYIPMPLFVQIILMVLDLVVLIMFAIIYVVQDNKDATYICDNCSHTFKISNKEAFLSMHSGSSKYVRCPYCKEKSFCKRIDKDE